MSNPLKKDYDRLSIKKDIAERERILHLYQTTGFIDRNDAIEKISSLQITDAEIALATRVKQAESGSIDLHQADNALIVANMQFQIDVLKGKLTKLEMEERHNG